jgi:hypothetical protein
VLVTLSLTAATVRKKCCYFRIISTADGTSAAISFRAFGASRWQLVAQPTSANPSCGRGPEWLLVPFCDLAQSDEMVSSRPWSGRVVKAFDLVEPTRRVPRASCSCGMLELLSQATLSPLLMTVRVGQR